MKIKFITQAYQSAAVKEVVDCFAGQASSVRGDQKISEPWVFPAFRSCSKCSS